MSKLLWAIFWVIGAVGWLFEAWHSHGDKYDTWLSTAGLTILALWCFGQAGHWFSRWLFAGEERVEMVECDCSAADKCPQGKVGQQGKCSIWKTIE